MALDKLQKTITKKLISSKLAHFILFNSTDVESSKLKKWCMAIVSEYFFNINQKKMSLENNPDVLFITDEAYLKTKFYDKSFMSDISHFLSHKALVGDKKFIIIENLKYLSEIHMNKLLKTLEEPPVEMHIFLLNPDNTKPLQTIISRSIQINSGLKIEGDNKKLLDSYQKLKSEPLHKFLELCKKNKELEENLAKHLIDNASSSNSIDLIKSLDHYLSTWSHDNEYNYQANSRLISLYNVLQNI